jgi:hypothetical protein
MSIDEWLSGCLCMSSDRLEVKMVSLRRSQCSSRGCHKYGCPQWPISLAKLLEQCPASTFILTLNLLDCYQAPRNCRGEKPPVQPVPCDVSVAECKELSAQSSKIYRQAADAKTFLWTSSQLNPVQTTVEYRQHSDPVPLATNGQVERRG